MMKVFMRHCVLWLVWDRVTVLFPEKRFGGLALEGAISQEYHYHVVMLVDDEELELQEFEAGLNPLTCSDQFAANGIHGCSLYKGWFCRKNLTKFYIMLNACIIFRFVYLKLLISVTSFDLQIC